jgi:autotransporter-associated beta strand protein
VTKNGTGTLTLTAGNSMGGALQVNSGTVNLSGVNTLSAGLKVSAGTVNVTASTTTSGVNFNNFGNTASTTAIGSISSGATLTWSGINGGDFADGGSAYSNSAALYNSGTFNITATSANSAGTYLPNAGNAYGYIYNVGAANISGRLWLGNGNGNAGSVGVLDVLSGTFTVSGTGQDNPLYLSHNGSTAATAINVLGGTFSLPKNSSQYQINNSAGSYSYINITGSGKLILVGDAGFNLNDVSDFTSVSILTVANGGELDCAYLYNNNAASTNTVFNFNGGMVKATATDGNGLFINNTAVYVYPGGATIDVNGFNPQVKVPLLAPSGNGVTSITLGGTTNGYVGAPLVKISGGGGQGASAIANFNPTTGTITNITVTAPGSGYTSVPTVILLGGKGGATGTGVGTATATATIGAMTSGGLTKQGTGTLYLTATNTYTNTTIIKAGTLALSGSGSIASSGIIISNGAIFDVSAVSFILGAGQTLMGSGTVTGGSTITGTIAPGVAAIGTLTFSTPPVLTSGKTLLELNRTNAQTSDRITVSGTLAYAGTLTVTNIGPALQAGDSFQLFSASGYSGAFNTTNLPALGSGLVWSNSLAANGKMAVVSTVSLVPTNVVLVVSGANLTLSWPADHTGWRLLMQTNNLGFGISANTNDWMTVGNSQLTNQVGLPLDLTLPGEFFRLVFP